MKTNEIPKSRVPAFSGSIALFVLFGLMFISSLHLEKKWDGIAGAAVCLIGLASFFISLCHHPAERQARLVVLIPAVVLGGVAAIGIWLICGRWH